MNIKIKGDKKFEIPILIGLWSLFTLSVLVNLSTMSKILNRMLTAGDPLPLQSLLNNFSGIWAVADNFWNFILTPVGYHYILYQYCWGGFTLAFLFRVLINQITSTAEKPVFTEREIFGRRLSLFYAMVIMGTIVFGLNRLRNISDTRNWTVLYWHNFVVLYGMFLYTMISYIRRTFLGRLISDRPGGPGH